MSRRAALGCLLIASSACGQRADPAAAPAAPGAVAMPVVAAPSQIAPGERAHVAAPWSLTASDGSGLMLTRVDAKAVFQGPLAFTELHLYFHNPEPRVREGTFAITLPARAAVSRFAMEGEQQWMEAEVVEARLARRAYEDFLHRRQDPALLERAEANRFSARVFPIPAGGDKHLVISYSQELPGERYVLPLRGLPRLERIDVQLEVLGADGKLVAQTLSQRNWLPDRDLVSDVAVTAEAVTAGATVAAQLAVVGGKAEPDAPAELALLVDTSASRGLGFAAMVQGVHQLVSELRKRHGDDFPVEIVAFDQETRAIFAGRAAEWGDAQDHRLLARGAAGASDLGQAIAWLGGRVPKPRVAVITDGVITAGATATEVAAQIAQLTAIERVDVVLTGGIRDEAAAAVLARASKRRGAVLDLEAGAADVARGLDERVLADVAIDVPGATWVSPRTIASLRAGSRVMVYARLAAPAQTIDERSESGGRGPAGLAGGEGARPLSIEAVVGGARRSLRLVGATPALVERAAAAAEIAELERRLDGAPVDAAEQLRADIAKRSIAARVVSSQTALLVLETERDYARYGIDRKALADVMVIGARGIELQRRAALPDAPEPELAIVQNEVRFDDKVGEKPDDNDDKVIGNIREPRIARAQDAATAQAVATRAVELQKQAEALGARGAREAREQYGSPALALALPNDGAPWPRPGAPRPLSGELADIARALGAGDRPRAMAMARAWHDKEPGNVLALIGLGDALEANHEPDQAARIYGSIIDLYPSRADLRRFAGERLERIGADARALAIDTYRRAVEQRPDHLTGHRLHAYALLRAGRRAEAFARILAGIDQRYPPDRFDGGDRVLRDDAGLIGAAFIAAEPGQRAAVTAALARRHIALATAPSTRFVLYWETDANDVDFHIQDARGGHAWYEHLKLRSGGELYADVTTGYGPECFTIPGTPTAGPYRLSLEYYAQGPMGYGMGLLQIVRHDGKGGLAFDDRPYVIMNDHAYVDLGSFAP